MNIEHFREECLKKKCVEETFPFGDDTLVYKVLGKMFALSSFSEPDRCNLKCDPERSIDLRATYEAVKPGFHMNKQHWNTVHYNQDLNDKEIIILIEHSYQIVVNSLPKKLQAELKIQK